jgi:SAM-dependent methyltransferase
VRDYRSWHQDPDVARRYDEEIYRPGGFDDWVDAIEERLLNAVVDRHFSRRPFSYLDFACGTGRVMAKIAPRAATAVGVDVSEAMLDRARDRVPGATFLLGDVSVEPGLLDRRFDLITSFRFLVNAEPELRRDALRALAAALHFDGLFVCNIHANRCSARLLTEPARIVGLAPRKNALSLTATTAALKEAGFVVRDVTGYAFAPRSVYRLLGRAAACAAERRLGTSRRVSHYGTHLLLVCSVSRSAQS